MPSEAAISVRVVDEDGRPVPNQTVGFYLDKGYFLVNGEPLGAKTLTVITTEQGLATATFACAPVDIPNLDTSPGEANLVAVVGDQSKPADVLSFRITVVGRPAFISLTAAPSKVVAGEAITILATVKDAINQEVADQTEGKFTTTPEGRLTDEITQTVNGVAMTYLLTSNSVQGIYTIVAVAGNVRSLVQVQTRLTGSSERGG